MGHCISVFVIKKDQAKIDLSKFVHVEGPQGFVILPDDKLWGLIKDSEGRALEVISEKISSGAVAYLTTDYFGGAGEQTGEYFDPVSKPGKVYELHCDSINKVLIEMGLVHSEELDEFDTLGLESYRSNEDFNPEKEKEEERFQTYFSAAKKKNSFTREEMQKFSEWCHQCYSYKGKDEWTHGAGGNEKNYSTDDLLTVYVSQQDGYTPE